MRAATAVGAAAILILVAEVLACPAGAEDAIKPGKISRRRLVGLPGLRPEPSRLPP